VNVIDGLSHAALRVGKGDFSVRVMDPEQDQLGKLAASFNAMTYDLENLREHEMQRAILERDIALGREAQQYLYPRRAPVLSRASVWGVTQSAYSQVHSHKVPSAPSRRCQLRIAQTVRTADRSCSRNHL
jgi:hypothetical protein